MKWIVTGQKLDQHVVDRDTGHGENDEHDPQSRVAVTGSGHGVHRLIILDVTGMPSFDALAGMNFSKEYCVYLTNRFDQTVRSVLGLPLDGKLRRGSVKRFWSDYTSEEFSRLDCERIIAVLPVGATEQHGPHLPLCVDAAVADGIARAVADRLPEELPVLFLPTQSIGKSDEHARYPGTLSLSGDVLARVWTEIGSSVARCGVRKIVLLNSHGGQISIMDQVVRELRIRHHMLAFSVNWFGFGMPEATYSDNELAVGIHAGDMETSVMLALHPELVRMDEARDFRPLTDELLNDYTHIRISGGAKLGWQAHDLHPAGACGNATLATAEKGEATLAYAADRLVEVLIEIDRAPLRWLDNEPEW